MKTSSLHRQLIPTMLFLATLSLTGCDKPADENDEFRIDSLTMDNYPAVDGSTSTEPLQVLIACKLLGVGYSWTNNPFWLEYPYQIVPDSDLKPDIGRYIFEHIVHSGTHSSFVNLIEKNTDLILVARTASADEIHLADSLGVTLVEIPVAVDAFIFLVNKNNPVNALTTKQIQDIYTCTVTNWSQVGGTDNKINPYQRNRNSGSLELMESLVMKGLTMPELPDMMVLTMMGLVNQIERDEYGIGYSVNYYTQYMIRSNGIKLISVDGVYPIRSTVKNKVYKYTANVYAVIRADLDQSTNAYKLFELLQADAGQAVVNESGYIPYN